MWARVERGRIVETYSAPRELVIRGIRYPKATFSNSQLMKKLGILPVRRVQANAPEDTSVYTSSEVYTVEEDIVLLTITWAKMTGDALKKRIEQVKVTLKAKAFGSAQARLQEMKEEQHKLFLTQEETQAVQDRLDEELARIDNYNPARR